MADCLAAARFDSAEQTFFTWLGVVPYLARESVWSTLGFIAGLPGGGHLVLDYSEPPESLSSEARAEHEQRAQRVAAFEEPWLCHFVPPALHAKLADLGFTQIDDIGPPEIRARYLPERAAASAMFCPSLRRRVHGRRTAASTAAG